MHGYSALGDWLKPIYLHSWVSDLCGLSCPQGRAVEAGNSAGPLHRHPMALQGHNLVTPELSWLFTKGFITCIFPLSRCITVASHHEKQAALRVPLPCPKTYCCLSSLQLLKTTAMSMQACTHTHSHTLLKNKKLNQMLLLQYQGQKKGQCQGLVEAKVSC